MKKAASIFLRADITHRDVESLRNKVADLTVVFFLHDSAFHSSKL